MKRSLFIAFIVSICHTIILAQTGDEDFWLSNGFSDGDTVYTNAGWFFDDGGNGVYQQNQDWTVTFCSENGSPLTLDFSNFRTHFGGTVGDGTFDDYDYITVDYPGASYVAYHDNTPEFSFTSQSSCITVGFISNDDGLVDSGWVAEIYALPPPFNNDPADAEELVVGNVCSPSFYSNKGAFNTTNLGNPPCQTYFGGDVWFRAVVPASGILKIETFAGTLDYAILDIYNSQDAALLASERIACVDDGGAMPSVILAAPDVNPGDVVYIRLFGEQAKSGLFGICASDPAAEVTGFTGPGGVGDSVSLDYWFKPDKGVFNNAGTAAADEQRVRTWEDQSGNEKHLVQDDGDRQPGFVANAHSHFGALQFDGTDDLFEIESGSGDAPVHWFAAGSFQGNQRQTMAAIGDAFAEKTASLSRDTDGRYFSYTGGDLYGPSLVEGQYYIFNASHTNNAPYHFLELNGQSRSVDPEPLPLETDGTFRLGASWNGSEPYAGRISEFIQYRKNLNQAQEIIVNNYLAAKYNIPLEINDLYPYVATFPFDVAGIGRVNADNTHTKAMSSGILSVSGADDFDDNEFLLFGHDNGDVTAWSNTGVPEGDTNIIRIERTWRTAVTGSPGAVSVSLEKGVLPTLPEGFAAYNILVDADGDFSTGAATYGPYEINSELVINNLPVSNGDYITIAAVRPVISFVNDSTAAFESVPNPLMEVALNYPVSTTVEISYSVTSGTAIQGEDYSLVSSSIFIDPGNSSAVIIPLIHDDDVPEIPDEYFEVRIATPTDGVSAGGITTAKHIILNDDLAVEIVAPDTITGACTASVAELVAVATGTGPFSYAWTPSDGLNSTTNDTVIAHPDATTTYTVNVTDIYGLSKNASVTVQVVPSPVQPGVSVNGPVTFCQGEEVVLEAPGGYASYLWSTGEEVREIDVTATGDYNVTVVDSFGCASPVSADVAVTVHPLPEQPVVTPPGPHVVITGDSILLSSSSAAAYRWSPGGASSSSIYVSATGDYSVVVENEFGCESPASESVSVTVNNFLPPPVVSVDGPLSFCNGSSVLLAGPAGYSSYTWSDGTLGRENRVTTGGSISLVVTNENGVHSQPSDEVLVTVFGRPQLVVEDSLPPLCHGDANGSITVKANGGTEPYSYAWTEVQETSSTLSSLPEGTYTVRVEDSNGCMDTLEVDLSEPAPLVVEDEVTHAYCPDFSDGSIELTEIKGGTPPYQVSWTGGETSEYLYDLLPGTYDYSVTDANGCSVEASVVIEYQNDACFVVPEIITPNNDGYNDYWRIDGLEVYPEVVIEIFDRWGRRVFYSEGHEPYFDGTFDGKELPMESYLYVIDLHNGSERIIGNLTIIR